MLPSKLAFVDIETTGLGVTHDKIIEIGILRVENGKLVKKFKSLINPEGFVSSFSLQLTGITEAELTNAPTFYEVMDDINDILKDCVFVAHNVRFDYGFIRNEFRRYEKKFSAKHFCTIKLSQRLFPNERKHNLDAIISRFNIKCINRHRAFDDALVLWEFYQKLQNSFEPDLLEKAISGSLKKPSVPLNITSETIESLPEKPGVYIFYGENKTPLYVGKSVNIQERVKSHFTSDYVSAKEMNIAQQIQNIETITTSGELGALIKESYLVKRLQPLYNRQLRITKRLYLLRKTINSDGYPEVRVETIDNINPTDLDTILGIFRSKKQAKEFLVPLVKKYNLCEKLLSLEKTSSSCFAYRLDICKGACVKEENPLHYSIRFAEAFGKHAIKQWPFPGPIVISEKDELEKTAEYFVVDKWCLLSQYNENELMNEQTKTLPYLFDLDTYKLLVRFLENRKNWKHIKQIPKIIADFSDGISQNY